MSEASTPGPVRRAVVVGAFGGFGLGAAAWTVYEAVRERLSEPKSSRRLR